MTLKTCLSCGGLYEPDQPGGYYHRCPPGIENPRNENIVQEDAYQRIKPGHYIQKTHLASVGKGSRNATKEEKDQWETNQTLTTTP